MTVIKGALAYFGSLRVSRDMSGIGLSITRPPVEASGLEHVVDQMEPGTLDESFSGATIYAVSPHEAQILSDMQAGGVEHPFLFIFPTPAVGGECILVTRMRHDQADPSNDRGTKRVLTVSGDLLSDPRFGQVVELEYGNSGISASGLSAGKPVLGALAAGSIATAIVHVSTPPDLQGTGDRVCQVDLWSSALGTPYTDRIVRATGTFATAPTGAQVQAPGALYLEVDGDTTPVTDTEWGLEYTLSGGAGAVWPITAALSIDVKAT